MLRNGNTTASRYGYVQTKNVPLMAGAAEQKQDDSLLEIAGKFVASAVGMYIGGRMLRHGAGSLLKIGKEALENDEFVRYGGQLTSWLGKRIEDIEHLDDALKAAEGIFDYTDNLGRAGKLSALEFIESEDVGSMEWARKHLVSKAAAAARALPFEITASYMVDRLWLNRKQLQEDIKNQKINPKSPLDWASDFSLQAVKYGIADTAMRFAPVGLQAAHAKLKNSSELYNYTGYVVKSVNAENMRWISQQGEKFELISEAAQKAWKRAGTELAANRPEINTEDPSLRHVLSRANPFKKQTWQQIHLAYQHFEEETLDEVKGRYRAIGMRDSGEGVGSDIVRDVRNFANQYRIDTDPETGRITGFGEVGQGFLVSQYNVALRDRLVAEYGLTPQAAERIIRLNQGRFQEDTIGRTIMEHARGADAAPNQPPRDIDAARLFSKEKIDPQTWAEETDELLRIRTMSRAGLDQEDLIQAMHDTLPTGKDAQQWRRWAAVAAEERKAEALREFTRMPALKETLRGVGHYQASPSDREALARRTLSALGFEDVGYKSTFAFNKFKQGIGAATDEEATRALRALAKSRRVATENPLAKFNVFGLRRMTLGEARQMDRSKPWSSDATASLGRYPTAIEVGTKREKESFDRGLREVVGYLGHRRTGQIYADPGLYVTMRGSVVDFRRQFKGAENFIRAVDRIAQVPIVGFKPLQLLGTRSFLDARESRFRYMPGGRNVFAYAENPDINPFAPTVLIGKDTFAANRGGDMVNIGRWNWLRNDPSAISTRAARTQANEPRTAYRRTEQRRKYAGGRFLLPPDAEHPERGGTAWGYKLAQKYPQVKNVIDWLDIEQDTTASLKHRVQQRVNRSVNFRPWVAQQRWFQRARGRSPLFDTIANTLGFDPTRSAVNEDFLPHRYQRHYVDPVKENLAQRGIDFDQEATRTTRRRRTTLNEIDTIRGMASDEERRARKGVFKDVTDRLDASRSAASNEQVSTVLTQVYAENDLPITFTGIANDRAKTLQAAANDVAEVATSDMLQPNQRNHVKALSKRIARHANGDLSSKGAREQLHNEINAFYIQVAGMASGDRGELVMQQMEEIAAKMYSTGTIRNRGILDQVNAAIAAARLRLVDSRYGAAKIDTLRTIGVSVPEALKRVAGPALSHDVSGVKTVFTSGQIFNNVAEPGNPLTQILGLKDVYRYTFGNKNWLYPEDLIDQNLPHAINPFEGSDWIAVRPFAERLGISGPLRQFSNVVMGRAEIADEGTPDTLRTLQGAVLGDKGIQIGGKTIGGGGTVTSATLAGWHAVSRVADVADQLGLGVELTKYASPADLFIRGLLGKRVLPVVGLGTLLGVTMGIPGIGKHGVVGAGAWAAGPGIGQARAFAMEKTGANEFFKTAADVMSLDEEARLRKWGRNYLEESEYWERGTVPIRKGRFWLLGSRPFKGTTVDYYRPNWYRMFRSDYQYTDEFKGSRLEWAAFGTDISPLHYVDPYHYERKWGDTRPYPISGELFTGPWGVMTPILNATVGAVIKPQVRMHANLDDEYRDAFARAVVRANGAPESEEDAIVLKYRSGKVKIGDLMVGDSAGTRLANINAVAKAGGRRRRRGVGLGLATGDYATGAAGGVGATDKATAERLAIDIAGEGTGATVSQGGRMVAALNRWMKAKSGERFLSSGSGSYDDPNLIPITDMPAISPRRYDFDTQYVINPQQALTGRTLGYRLGELGYLAQEFGGIYGFGFGSLREVFGSSRDYSPTAPKLQNSSRAYGMERQFWDLDAGGMGDVLMPWKVNVQLSEISRRFLPHKRNDIEEYNPIPNKMPDWMPTSDTYFIDFSTGDPFVKVKLGEARLPGKGYEKLNALHPDAFGRYGAFDRFKILADTAAYSKEYRYYRDILAKTQLDPEVQEQVAEIKRQVAEKKKKIVIHPRKWNGKLEKLTEGELVQATGKDEKGRTDPNLYTLEGLENPVRLAGVRFSKSAEGQSAAKAFYNTYIKGKSVQVYYDAEHPGAENNREKSYDVIIKSGRHNLNDMLRKRAADGEKGITLSQGTSFIDSVVKFGPGWVGVGKLWEAVSHVNIPLKNKILLKQSADEYYQQRLVYGKLWQPWQTPVESFLRPFEQTVTRPGRGAAGWIAGSTMMGILAGGFIDKYEAPGLHGAGRLIGAALGLALGVGRSLYSAAKGQLWTPKRRRREWAVDEYADILNYVKYSRLYEQQRQRAIAEEGIDPEVWNSDNQQAGAALKQAFQQEWDNAPVGGKPNKPESQKSLESLGPESALAMEFKKRRDATMYGASGDDIMNTMYAVPKRYRDLFQDLMETPVSKRKHVLDTMPRLMRRIFEQKWEAKVEKKPDLIEYFKRHELPGPDWEGWLPDVNLDEVKIKILKHEGLDASEFGYYPQQVESAMAMPWAFPEYRKHTPMNKEAISEYLASMGVRDVQVDVTYGQGISGFDMHLTHDRRGDIRGMLNG